MNNVVDSSCWIEFAQKTAIGYEIAPIIRNSTDLVVPSITIYEVYKKMLAAHGESFAQRVVDYMRAGKEVSLDSTLSIFAAQVGQRYGLALADSIIYATALNENAVLWTTDKHFKNIADVRYFDNVR